MSGENLPSQNGGEPPIGGGRPPSRGTGPPSRGSGPPGGWCSILHAGSINPKSVHPGSPQLGGGPPGGGDPYTGAQSPSPQLPNHYRRALSDHTDYTAVRRIGEFLFDRKLKPEIIPTWDGNGDQLGDWLISVGDLADQGTTIYTELGQIVPMRFKGDASTWFWSLGQQARCAAMHSWGTLHRKICEFWMSCSWSDKQKVRANKATYRESIHSQESLVQYVIQKLKLLQLVDMNTVTHS